MGAKQKTDWDALEPHYRAGVKSLRQLADEFGCTSGRVAQVAKERCWERDLSAKIAAKAESKLSRSILSKELSAAKVISENEIVEANATMQADIILAHRRDITRSRALAVSMLAELESTTGDNDLFHQLGELLLERDKNGIDKLNDIYRKVISMPGRIDSMKKLAETIKILIGQEREAFGIESGKLDDQSSPIGSFRLVPLE